MCDWLTELNWLKVINGLLSLVLLVMNGVYAIWGLCIRSSSSKRDNLVKYIDQLEFFTNLVSYTDGVVVPFKIIILLLLKRCCGVRCGSSDSDDQADDGFGRNSPRRDPVSYDARGNVVKTFQCGTYSTEA